MFRRVNIFSNLSMIVVVVYESRSSVYVRISCARGGTVSTFGEDIHKLFRNFFHNLIPDMPMYTWWLHNGKGLEVVHTIEALEPDYTPVFTVELEQRSPIRGLLRKGAWPMSNTADFICSDVPMTKAPALCKRMLLTSSTEQHCVALLTARAEAGGGRSGPITTLEMPVPADPQKTWMRMERLFLSEVEEVLSEVEEEPARRLSEDEGPFRSSLPQHELPDSPRDEASPSASLTSVDVGEKIFQLKTVRTLKASDDSRWLTGDFGAGRDSTAAVEVVDVGNGAAWVTRYFRRRFCFLNVPPRPALRPAVEGGTLRKQNCVSSSTFPPKVIFVPSSTYFSSAPPIRVTHLLHYLLHYLCCDCES